ncbi:DUF4424 domain-containing protein [Aquabacter cavernae]|uniref:DUF4424 domain-containing protein n=1 Tax=Aquabacter cavernae TaxID=2496029 RepID=UPI000F8E7CC5|nr:DUF4424 domain-containing protein [Aquabacter cavernae]
MRRVKQWVPVAALAALFATGIARPAAANDSSAELRAGGLVLVPNEVVSMVSEDLFVSEKEVRVRYLFRNTSDKDVTLLVAFPMPDLAYSESPISIPFPDVDNFLDFKTRIDGKPVETKMERRVISFGLDRTKLLEDLKIPLDPTWRKTVAALDALPDEAKRQLLEIGLVRVDEYDAGKGWERHLAPLDWTLKTTYYWTQTFPAKRDLKVEHHYAPSVGMSVGTLVGDTKPDDYARRELRRMDETFCIDSAFKAAAAKVPRMQGSSLPNLSEVRLGYILKTGANWSGPISSFTLTVDKGAPENLVSFCGTGVKKIGPTTFQMQAKDFTPETDLNILILKPYPK